MKKAVLLATTIAALLMSNANGGQVKTFFADACRQAPGTCVIEVTSQAGFSTSVEFYDAVTNYFEAKTGVIEAFIGPCPTKSDKSAGAACNASGKELQDATFTAVGKPGASTDIWIYVSGRKIPFRVVVTKKTGTNAYSVIESRAEPDAAIKTNEASVTAATRPSARPAVSLGGKFPPSQDVILTVAQVEQKLELLVSNHGQNPVFLNPHRIKILNGKKISPTTITPDIGAVLKPGEKTIYSLELNTNAKDVDVYWQVYDLNQGKTYELRPDSGGN